MAYPSVTNTFVNGNTADATAVNQNFTDLINGCSDGTKDLNVNAGTFGSTLTANGAVTLGASSANLIVVNGSINSTVPVNTNTSYDLGTSTKGFRSIYIGGSSTFTVRLLGATQAASYTLTLPTTAGTNTYVLQTDGSGVLSWINHQVAPTVQKFTSGSSQTYTTPSSPRTPTYLRLRIIGGGGGGAGGGTASGSAPGGGNASSFSGSGVTLTANGGGGGTYNTAAAGGGSASITGATGTAVTGSGGSASDGTSSAGVGAAGQMGGSSFFGGAGAGGDNNAGAGGTAATNSGSGGGGGGSGGGTPSRSGGSGGAGGYIDAIITTPAATYTYTVGGTASAGSAGTSGGAGGAGAAGYIEVTEYYQ